MAKSASLASPARSDTQTAPQGGANTVPSAAILNELLKLLPPGATSHYAFYGLGAETYLDGASGLGMIRVFLYLSWRRIKHKDPYWYSKQVLLRTYLDHKRLRSSAEVQTDAVPEQPAGPRHHRLALLGGPQRPDGSRTAGRITHFACAKER